MPRDIQEPTRIDRDDDRGVEETHPAFGQAAVYRTSGNAVLFDSDVRHQHYMVLKISGASRRRDLNHDWIHSEKTIIEVAMSEAQWAAVVSSVNSSGVPVTIEYRQGEGLIPGLPFEPRMKHSIQEVKDAADKAVAKVAEAFEALEEAFEANAGKKVMRGLMRNLHTAVAHMPANATFAATSLNEHVENVIQKARVDLEAIVTAKATQLGIDPAEVMDTKLLTE